MFLDVEVDEEVEVGLISFSVCVVERAP